MDQRNRRQHAGASGYKLNPVRLLIILLAFSLTGCDVLSAALDLPWFGKTAQPGETTPIALSQTAMPTEQVTETTPTPAPPPTELTIWLPAEMDPGKETQAATLFQARLDTFAAEHGITVNVRLKNLNGPAGLLDAITAAAAAAPDVLPDLVVLQRKDLETAALKSLVQPLDALTTIVDGEDWFPYARNLGLIQNVVYGIPFVGDPLTLVYDAEMETPPQSNWASIATNEGNIAIFADDSQAAFMLTLYLSLGGLVEDNQRHPILEVSPLTRALQVLKEANQKNKILPGSLQFTNENQVWEAFDEKNANMAVVSTSRLLRAMQIGRDNLPEPAIRETSLTLATGWVYAVATPKTERQTLAVALAEFLTEPGFLSSWSEAIGRVPVRPSSLASWKSDTYKLGFTLLSNAAVMVPSNEVMASIAPVLREATMLILKDNADPGETARQAVENLK